MNPKLKQFLDSVAAMVRASGPLLIILAIFLSGLAIMTGQFDRPRSRTVVIATHHWWGTTHQTVVLQLTDRQVEALTPIYADSTAVNGVVVRK